MDNAVSLPEDILVKGLEELAIPYDNQKIALCQHFFREYHSYSQKINISTIHDPSEFVIKHILDSLVALPFIRPGTKTLADLGSGGGIPGVIIAIFAPELSITLIDVIEKKVEYLHHIIELLKLPHVQAFNASKKKVPGSFDLIVTRALGSLSKILLYAKPYITSQTEILAYKGRMESLVEEMQSLKKTPFQISIKPVHVPFLEAQRHLAFFHRKKKD